MKDIDDEKKPNEKNDSLENEGHENASRLEIYKNYASHVIKAIEDQHVRYASYIRKAYGFITVTIAIIAFVLSNFEYNLYFKNNDMLIHDMTIVFSTIFLFGLLLLLISFAFMVLSIKQQQINLIEPEIFLDNVLNDCYSNEEELYYKTLNDSYLESYKSFTEKVKLRKLYFRIGLIIGSSALFIIVLCYVALRIIITR